MRYAKIERKTGETDIILTLDLDGEGKSEIETGCGLPRPVFAIRRNIFLAGRIAGRKRKTDASNP